MNIDNLTIAEVKQIAQLASSFSSPVESKNHHPFVGRYVIARCYSAGVHAGTVVSVDGDTVILKDSRRLWQWKAQDGIALSGVAQSGIKKDSTVDTTNPEIYLTGVCELIPCSKKSEDSINGA
jgi:hypothetical protein